MATQKERDALARSVKKTTKPATAASLQKKSNKLTASYGKVAATQHSRLSEVLAKNAAMEPSAAKKAKYSHTVTLRQDKMGEFKRQWEAAGSKEERMGLIASVQDQERAETLKQKRSKATSTWEKSFLKKNAAYGDKNRALYEETGKAIDAERVKAQKDASHSLKGRAGSILQKGFSAIDFGRRGVTSAVTEVAQSKLNPAVSGKLMSKAPGPLGTVGDVLKHLGPEYEKGLGVSDKASVSDWWEQTKDPSKGITGSELIEKNKTIPKSVRKNRAARTALGFGVDIGADPLTYVMPVGIAAHGSEAVGEEVARNVGAKMVKEATEQSVAKIGAERTAKILSSPEGQGKLIEALRRAGGEGAEKMAATEARGAAAAAKAARTGVSHLSKQEIAEFLTREGASKPSAQRGLGFLGKVIPGTDVGPLARLGEAKSELLAKAGQAIRERGGKVLEGHALEKALIKSGNPEEALKAIQGRLTRQVVSVRGEKAAEQLFGRYRNEVKTWAEADKHDLIAAIEGDTAAADRLGGKHLGVQAILDEALTNAQKAGLNVQKTEDYFPRIISSESRQALEDAGVNVKQGASKGKKFFEKGRKLTPGEEHTFMGEKVFESTAAGVRKRVDAIAREKLGQDAAFFADDADEVMAHYLGSIAKRTAQSEGARDLYNKGYGVTVAEASGRRLTPESREFARQLTEEYGVNQQRAVQLAERADQQDEAVLQLQQHLLSERAGQLEATAAGQGIDQPMSDRIQQALARLQTKGAEGDVTAIESRLSALQAEDAARAIRRGRRADELDQEIGDLRAEYDKLKQANNPGERALKEESISRRLQQIEDLRNPREAFQRRFDMVMEEALSGHRPDVVLPEGYKMQDIAPGGLFNPDTAHQDMLPFGSWKEVHPRDAYLNASASSEYATKLSERRAKLDMIVEHANEVGDTFGETRQHQFDAVTELIDQMHPGWSLQQIQDETNKYFVNLTDEIGGGSAGGYVTNTGKAGEKQSKELIHNLFHTYHETLLKEERDMAKRMEKAAHFAERNPDTGLVHGPLYHGTPNGLPEDQFVDRIDTWEHVQGNLDKGGAYTTDDQTGQIIGGHLLAGPEAKTPAGYMIGWDTQPEWAKGYTYAPTDPEARLLPSNRLVGLEDLSDETASLIDDFYQGADWTMDDVSGMWGNPNIPSSPYSAAMQRLTSEDPIHAFLVDDAVRWAEVSGVQINPENLAETRTFSGLYNRLGSDIQNQVGGPGADMNHAAAIINDFRDHLYDDLHIKGLTREGGANLGHGIEHNHHVWFRPSEDLQLVGKADYSAALAQQGLARIDHMQAGFTRMNETARAALEAQDETVAKAHEAWSVAEAKRAKYGKAPGTVKVSMRTQRASEGVQAAYDQLDMARVFERDTADVINERVTKATSDAADIRQWLLSDQKMTPKMRAHLEEVHDALADGVKWGNVHQRALDVGDQQLARLSAMEEASAATRATLSDLHHEAMNFQMKMGNLPTEQYRTLTEQFKRGAYEEIHHNIGTPQEMADLMTHVDKLMVPENMQGLMKQYDKVVNWLKSWQIATPGFVERNLMGGFWNNGFEGVSLRSYNRFGRAMAAGKRGEEALARFEAKNPEVARLYREIQEIVGHGNVGSDIVMGAKRNKFPKPWSANSLYVRGMVHVNTDAEIFLRGSLAYHIMEGGGSREQAVAAINRLHFDYGDLSNVEQGIKKVIPFYTWSRKNIPLQMQMITKQPKQFNRYGSLVRNVEAQSSGDRTTPSYFPEMGAFRLPFQKQGGHIYAAPDLPFRDLQTVLQSPKEAFLDTASMVTPVVKTPIEYAMGKQAFKGLELGDKPVPIPAPAVVVKGIAPALQALGLAQKAGDGSLVMSQKNAYVLEQFAPMLARTRRMIPAGTDEKGKDKQVSSIVSTLFGINIQTNTKKQQDISDYYDSKAVIDTLKAHLDRAVIGQPEARKRALYADYARKVRELTAKK